MKTIEQLREENEELLKACKKLLTVVEMSVSGLVAGHDAVPPSVSHEACTLCLARKVIERASNG
jgi:hypothetical protein